MRALLFAAGFCVISCAKSAPDCASIAARTEQVDTAVAYLEIVDDLKASRCHSEADAYSKVAVEALWNDVATDDLQGQLAKLALIVKYDPSHFKAQTLRAEISFRLKHWTDAVTAAEAAIAASSGGEVDSATIEKLVTLRRQARQLMPDDEYIKATATPTTRSARGSLAVTRGELLAQFFYEPIEFEFNSTKFSKKGEAAAQALARSLSNDFSPKHKLTLIGHTDTRGSGAANCELSRRRLQAVETSLRSAGVTDAIALIPAGEGTPPDDPVESADLSQEQRWQLERRVEIRDRPAQKGDAAYCNPPLERQD